MYRLPPRRVNTSDSEFLSRKVVGGSNHAKVLTRSSLSGICIFSVFVQVDAIVVNLAFLFWNFRI